ncbi:MAG TPA: hypothetical protein DCQ83_01250 [Fibrobacteres bacterium]|jgi:DMSO/TMAO reductase YedYZ molybdopterin-dependent catalytic subunit|nr:hypothetical protein [Fibrobacterota bacterium]
MNPENGKKSLFASRRSFLAVPPALFLAGCRFASGGKVDSTLKGFQRFNDWIQAKVFDPKKMAQEYSDEELTPEDGFRVNGYDTDEPDMDIPHWRLIVDGLVQKPGEYSMEEITKLPKYVKNLRHCCVEGWSMIPKWGGVLMKDFLDMVGADPKARYIAAECGDDYYTAWDMPSAMHSQTLLAYEAYGKPLELEHGAPLRVVMPVKLGYKSAKWITRLTITNEKPGGYWEDQGYDWFAGL